MNNIIMFIQACAGIATAVAVGYAIQTYKSSQTKRQFDLAKDIQNDITAFNRELSEIDNNDDEGKQLLYERLFNTLEWLGLLINKKQIKKNEIIQYFKKMVIQYYENTFLDSDFITKEQIEDPDEFPEFKKLYKKLKECYYD